MSTTLTFGDEEFATVRLIRKKNAITRMWNAPYVFAEEMFASGSEEDDGGEKGTVEWEIGEHSETTQLTTGYEPVSLVGNPIAKAGVYDLGIWARPVLMSIRDDIVNRGPEMLLNRLALRMDNTEMGIMKEFEEQWLQATNLKMSDLNPINGADSTDGFIEAAAVGAQTNTVHMVSKGDYLTLPGFQNQFKDAAGSYATNGLVMHNQIILATRNKAALAIKGTKPRGYVHENVADFYWRVLQPKEQLGPDAVSAAKNSGPKISFVTNGVEHRICNSMPAAGVATLTNPWSVLIADHARIQMRFRKGYKMKFIPLTPSYGAGTLARVGYWVNAGQTVIDYWGSSGVMVDANAF